MSHRLVRSRQAASKSALESDVTPASHRCYVICLRLLPSYSHRGEGLRG